MDFKIMKKIVFGFLMTFSVLQSQNNLIYNEAKFVQIVNNPPVVVPDGKVWKIESYSNGVGANRAGTLNINGQDFVLTLDRPSGGVIWAPAGSIIKGGPSSSTGSMFPINVINVIEFNVVPTSTGTGSGSGGGGVSSDGLIFEEALSITLPITQVESSAVRYYADIVVPEGKILKIINVSTYVEFSGNGNTSGENNNNVYIGPELFIPLQNTNQNITRFLPQGTYSVKTVGNSATNKVVVNAIQYTQF